MPLNKIGNEYIKALGSKLYADTPKAVLGAMVVSLLTCGGDQLDNPESLIANFMQEWESLHSCGIVPQKPPRRVGWRGRR